MPVDDRRRDGPRVHPATAAQWRAWLADHHTDEPPGVWLVSWRAPTGRSVVGYEAAIEEALAYGWIDSTAIRIDDERSAIWFTRRRPGSGWSRSNKERVARLLAQGRMADAGRACVASAQADGSWTRLDGVEELVVPRDLAGALDARQGAWETWEAFTPSVRRSILAWVADARRAPTREARVEEAARLAGEGKAAHQPRRP